MSGDSDDLHNDESVDEEPNIVNDVPEPIVDIQDDITMQDIVGEESILEAAEAQMNRAVPDVETFNITHRSAIDGSLINPAATAAQATMAFAPPRLAAPTPTLTNVMIPNLQQHPWNPRFPPINLPAGPVLPGMPRDEDVLMSLQLLAYVSKYCNLRAYFQSSHLVPRLKLGKDLNLLNTDYDASTHVGPTQEELDEDWDNEFVETENESDYNIFPLIEKFTARASSRHSVPQIAGQQTGDMQYWAGVVMRNLCRKDESRGGIRQCAYWQCGKWEEYTRQFAKCRRCRRTKYCSKECQKGAWGSHRFWCISAEGEGDRHHPLYAQFERLRDRERAAHSQLHHHHHHHHH
ncbi:hypothetical protein LTR28_006579 [Elasticomyces elasticus]|nr:hypothetical protein LTR28_006579 [Elasticomyces elasticus]